jgi:hypothetical protein
MSTIPPPDDVAHQDGVLMAEVTEDNTLLGRMWWTSSRPFHTPAGRLDDSLTWPNAGLRSLDGGLYRRGHPCRLPDSFPNQRLINW